MITIFRLLIIIPFRFRYVRFTALWLARFLGRIFSWLRSSWRPLVFWLLVITLGIWFAEHLVNPKSEPWFQISNIQSPSVLFSSFSTLLAGVWLQWWKILGAYTVTLLLWWIWQARKRVVIEDFMDYTGDEPKTDARGLATILVVKLGALRELYRNVDEQRAIPTSVFVNETIDATIKVEDVSEFLKDAVSAQSKFSLGPLEIPVGTLLALIGRIVQGPRIIGSLHKDKTLLILTAQKIGEKQPYKWRVERPIPVLQSTDQNVYNLDDMVAELGCRMFTDLALSGSVRWRATAAFSEGLEAYRACLRTPEDRKLKLRKAEKKFIETLVEDQKFYLAYYNLGVVYTELEQDEAAENAFLNAIKQNPALWNAYYALALTRFQSAKQAKAEHETSIVNLVQKSGLEKDAVTKLVQASDLEKDAINRIVQVSGLKGTITKIVDEAEREKTIAKIANEVTIEKALSKTKYDSIVELCKRVIDLKPGITSTAKAYQSIGLAQSKLKNRKNLKKAIRSFKKATAYSWRALCRAELKGQDLSDMENSSIAQLETLASICLANLAVAYRDRVMAFEGGIRRWFALRRAKALLKQALYLTRSDADNYAYYYYELGETHYALGKYDQALREYKHASRICPEKVEFLASIALAFAFLEDKENALDACEKALDYAFTAPREAFTKAFEKTTEAYAKLRLVETTPQRQRHEVVKKYLEEEKEVMELEENKKKGKLSVDEFEKKLKEKLAQYDHQDQEWGYAQISLALWRLYRNSHESEKVEEGRKYCNTAVKRLETLLPNQDEGLEWKYGRINSTLGALQLDLGKAGEAEKSFREAIKRLKKYPGEIRSLGLQTLLAESLLKQEKDKEALQATEQAIVGDSLNHLERKELGRVYFNLNDYEQAIAAFKDALMWRNALLPKPEGADIYHAIGASYLKFVQHRRELSSRTKTIREASGYFRQALDLFESYQQEMKDESRFALGYFHLELAEYEQAISYLMTSLTHRFAPLTSTFFLGYAFLKNKEYDESLKQFETLGKEAQTLVSTVKDISKVTTDEDIGQMPPGELLALAYWGQAFTYVDRDVNLDEALGFIKTAREYIGKVDKVAVRYPAVYPDCEGWIYYKLGEIDRAIECLKEAVKLTADAEIYLHLALAYESKLQKSKSEDKAQLITKIEIYCQHVQELDVRKDYEQRVEELLQRIQEKSQEVQPVRLEVMMHEQQHAGPKNNSSSNA